MALDVVKKISEIEKQGEELIKEAQRRANDILKNAKDEAENIKREAQENAEAFYRETIAKFEHEAKNQIEPMIADAERKKQEITNIPKDKMERAINMVIERIVNSHGNS
ncbi:MAG: hypothetical protein N2Z71_01930 [Caloramator sp.]|nr:hypothetical protein [Caloramator sp.]